jgi:predicted lipoprotein with Yx(FWY)xxD motif
MLSRRKVIYAAIALTGLASVTACGARPATGTDTTVVPVAATSTGEPAGAGGEAPFSAEPIPEPTVAKTQKWVKIYSGPSAKDIETPKSRKGHHTIQLNTTASDLIGTYVTDGRGRTLYRFDDDSAKPPKATCNGDCATAWPPLLIKSPGKIYPKGINPKILGYVERADHTCQVTINGHPVYYFVTDARPGDINGQGVNGKWFAISPNGSRTRALPGPLSATGNPAPPR